MSGRLLPAGIRAFVLYFSALDLELVSETDSLCLSVSMTSEERAQPGTCVKPLLHVRIYAACMDVMYMHACCTSMHVIRYVFFIFYVSRPELHMDELTRGQSALQG